MAGISALQRLLNNQLTSKFARSLKHSDLPEGWADNPEIVELAKDAYREAGTESPFFKAWFGNSKVVDEAGEPLEVYHGGQGKTEDFSRGPKRGILGKAYFTDDINSAAKYALAGGINHKYDELSDYGYDAVVLRNKLGNWSPNITKAYLKMDNPLNPVTDKMQWDALFQVNPEQDFIERLAESDFILDRFDGNIDEATQYLSNRKNLQDRLNELFDADYTMTLGHDATSFITDSGDVLPNADFLAAVDVDKVPEFLKAAGNDGVVYPDQEIYQKTFVPQRSHDIKSTSNRGTFNPADPNIYRALPWAVGLGAGALALSPEEAEAAPYQFPADRRGTTLYEPGLESPVVDPVDVLLAPIGAVGAGAKAAAMAAEPFLSYGMDKVMGGILDWWGD